MNLFARYGVMASSGGGVRNIILDGVIQSGFAFTNSTLVPASSYGTSGTEYYVTATAGLGGGYINIGDVTNYDTLTVKIRCLKSDKYNGLVYHNSEDTFDWDTYDGSALYIPNAVTTKTIDISSDTGKSCINIFTNVSTAYVTEITLS